MFCQRANAERFGRGDRLAPAESLYQEPIKRVSKCAGRTIDGDHLTVNRAVGIPDMLRFACSKLENQKEFAVPAEHLGAFVLVRVSTKGMNFSVGGGC